MITLLDDCTAVWAPRAGDPASFALNWWPVAELVESLCAPWDSDLFFLPFCVQGLQAGVWQPVPEACAPFLTPTTVSLLAASNLRIRFAYGVMDFNCPEVKGSKKPAPDVWRQQVRLLVAQAAPGCLRYDTRAGLRCVWALPQGLDEVGYEAMLGDARAVFVQAGLQPAALPWHTPMRLPRVRRDGVLQDYWRDLCQPAVWSAPGAAPAKRLHKAACTPPVQLGFAMPTRVAQAGRYDALKALAGALVAQGRQRAGVLAELYAADKRCCDPPLASEYGGHAEIAALLDFAVLAASGAAAFEPRVLSERVLGRGDSTEIAECVIEDFEEVSRGYGIDGDVVQMVFDLGLLWRYDAQRGVWTEVEQAYLVKRILKYANTTVQCGEYKSGEPKTRLLALSYKQAEDIAKCIAAKRDRRNFFARAQRGVALRDGFVTVHGGLRVRQPHAPSNGATFCYDFDWTDEPPAALFHCLDSLWADRTELERDQLKVILGELCGAALCGFAPDYQKGCMCFGSGANGKSTLFDIIEGCFPDATVAHMAPHELGQPYNAAELVGKRLNICSEIPSVKIDNLSATAIKKVITADPLTTRRIFGSPFTFRTVCGVLANLNGLPKVEDLSDGFFRRWFILPFTMKFEGDADIKGLARQVLLEDRQRIVCWMLQCAAALVKRGHYDEPECSALIVREWRKGMDPVLGFLDDGCEPFPLGTPCAEIYQGFNLWCTKNGYAQMDSAAFFRRFAPIARSKFGAGHSGSFDERVRIYMLRLTGN